MTTAAESLTGTRCSQFHHNPPFIRTIVRVITFPDIGPGEPLSVSASLYVTYLRCAGQALAQCQGRYGPESRASFAGMLAHRIFARHLSAGPIVTTGFEAACRQEIGQAMNPKLAALQLRPSELRGVIAEVGALYERFQAVSVARCRRVEAEITYEVSAEVTLRGRIDAVFDDPRGVRLVDWKTGSLGTVEHQLDFYALLWTLEHGEPPAVVEAASVASGERYEQHPTPESLTTTAARVAELIDTLRSGFVDENSVQRTGGPGCRFCPLHEECAEGLAALRVLSA